MLPDDTKGLSASQQKRKERLAKKEQGEKEAAKKKEQPPPEEPTMTSDSPADLAPIMDVVQEKINDLVQVSGISPQQAAVMLTHQVRINPVHELVGKCVQDIHDRRDDIPLREQINMLDKIASTYQKLIPLERQSYGIPDAKNRLIDTYGDPFEEFLNALSDRATRRKPKQSGDTVDAEVIEDDQDFALPSDSFEKDEEEVEFLENS